MPFNATPDQAVKDVKRLLAILSAHETAVYGTLSDDELCDFQMIELRWADDDPQAEIEAALNGAGIPTWT